MAHALFSSLPSQQHQSFPQHGPLRAPPFPTLAGWWWITPRQQHGSRCHYRCRTRLCLQEHAQHRTGPKSRNRQDDRTTDEGPGNIFLTKVTLDGVPTDMWTYTGSSNHFPARLATSKDDDQAFVSMNASFSGHISFGAYTLIKTKDYEAARDGFLVKVSSTSGDMA